MEFVDKITELSKKIREEKDFVSTEQAAKQALVLPFLNMLGYNIFNSKEVIPEMIADWAEKKGEKVDYSIKANDKVVMLIECKPVNDLLDVTKEDQLARYFSNTLTSRYGLLTNGIVYKFYTDLEQPNIMDKKPFLVFDFLKPDLSLVPTIQMFSKEKITDESAIKDEIIRLRAYSAVCEVIKNDFHEPSDDWTRYIVKQLPFIKRVTDDVLSEYKNHVKLAAQNILKTYFKEQVDALVRQSEEPSGQQPQQQQEKDQEKQDEQETTKITTTVEELQGLSIIKSILYRMIPPDKILMDDYPKFCSIVYAAKGRPTIAKLYFNESAKGEFYINLPNHPEMEKQGKIKIDSLENLNDYAEHIIKSAELILAKQKEPKPEKKDKSATTIPPDKIS
ncbi:MAG TPA: type I restriction enzyme HsdR N-terminal domain-containing protein [Caldisericia bacterium]|nr:MAG: hypothetical protein BWX90_01462 [bacterium ADurb.Bin132]HNW31466.1 type I restriction enzyme HsdR N-terminal domain-containing protein [Caldisericia bacterium]HNY61630.1 type I restriction enzyme HsdR N-terminal domain-containing protein [Caldisericia bacterium]HOC79481.1 type I restriction enzyme HsdR N-terminal domain-containing protein [Caldisericia bacterium]HOG70631.1 type I restriction enzyme HsdR N-terminal domain-containing protein [Caldisericia bacterium]